MKRNSKNLFIFIGLIIVILVVFGQYVLQKQQSVINLPNIINRNIQTTELNSQQQPSPTQSATSLETVSIDFGNGKNEKGEVYVQTVYQALQKLATDKKIDVEIKQYKYGIMVIKIGDMANGGQYGWIYKVNGKTGTIAADRYVIYPGDHVEWIYSKF